MSICRLSSMPKGKRILSTGKMALVTTRRSLKGELLPSGHEPT